MAGEWCAAASGLGLDLNTFVPTVAYGIHFITLEDLRYPKKLSWACDNSAAPT